MNPRLPAALLVLALATAGLASCDYFRPSEPEPPSRISFVPDYTFPDSTLATIAKAIADKGRTIGSTAYAGAYAESVTAASPAAYHHYFSQEDIDDWRLSGKQVPDWGFRLETSAFYNSSFLTLRPDDYRMEWAKDSLNYDDEANGIYYRHYQITSHAEDGTRTSFLAIGYAKLKMLRFSDGNWRIVTWEDRIDPAADPGDPEQVSLGRRRLNTQ